MIIPSRVFAVDVVGCHEVDVWVVAVDGSGGAWVRRFENASIAGHSVHEMGLAARVKQPDETSEPPKDERFYKIFPSQNVDPEQMKEHWTPWNTAFPFVDVSRCKRSCQVGEPQACIRVWLGGASPRSSYYSSSRVIPPGTRIAIVRKL